MKQSQGLGKGVPLLRGVVAQAQESIPWHNRWHKKDKRQLRNYFHLTAWDKALIPPPHPLLHSLHYRTQRQSLRGLRGPRERGGQD